MYTPEQSAWPIIEGMHIHPSLSEVVQRAFHSLVPPQVYHHIIEHHFGAITWQRGFCDFLRFLFCSSFV